MQYFAGAFRYLWQYSKKPPNFSAALLYCGILLQLVVVLLIALVVLAVVLIVLIVLLVVVILLIIVLLVILILVAHFSALLFSFSPYIFFTEANYTDTRQNARLIRFLPFSLLHFSLESGLLYALLLKIRKT